MGLGGEIPTTGEIYRINEQTYMFTPNGGSYVVCRNNRPIGEHPVLPGYAINILKDYCAEHERPFYRNLSEFEFLDVIPLIEKDPLEGGEYSGQTIEGLAYVISARCCESSPIDALFLCYSNGVVEPVIHKEKFKQILLDRFHQGGRDSDSSLFQLTYPVNNV